VIANTSDGDRMTDEQLKRLNLLRSIKADPLKGSIFRKIKGFEHLDKDLREGIEKAKPPVEKELWKGATSRKSPTSAASGPAKREEPGK